MSAPAIATPGSVQRGTKPTAFSSEMPLQQQEIANLAYTLWQQRGAPIGSSEQDWLEAERILQNQTATGRLSR